jgi:hypothetical protein
LQRDPGSLNNVCISCQISIQPSRDSDADHTTVRIDVNASRRQFFMRQNSHRDANGRGVCAVNPRMVRCGPNHVRAFIRSVCDKRLMKQLRDRICGN